LLPSPNTKKFSFYKCDRRRVWDVKQKEVGTLEPTSLQKENIFLKHVSL
jgi:hypothetical protein